MAAQQTGLGQGTEAAGEREVLVMVHDLPSEEQDAAFTQELPQRGNRGVSQLIADAQVQTDNFRAGAPGQGPNLVGQCQSGRWTSSV